MPDAPPHPRDRILLAAARLLAEHGRDGVSTRSVSAAAGVQPQTIYRQYGDMRGLMDAVAKYGFGVYYDAKVAGDGASSPDPVDALRSGWDAHVDFALANPALYGLMFGDARPGRSEAAGDVEKVLGALLDRVARSGRLTMSVEKATRIVLAANVGAALALIARRDDADPSAGGLSAAMREIVVGAIVDEDAATGPSADADSAVAARSAVALSAALSGLSERFTPGESTLLGELLARID